MVDARWTDVDTKLQETINHFQWAIQLFEQNQFNEPDLEGYKARMAFMHAMQTGYNAFENVLLKILSILDEPHPRKIETGDAVLIKRAAREVTGSRPAILSSVTAGYADELMHFRDVAGSGGSSFRPDDAKRAVAAARKLIDRILSEIITFRTEIDHQEQ